MEHLEKLDPIPTGLEPSFRFDNSIKSCIFDIYGTLLISSSGDIDRLEMTSENLKIALREAKIPMRPDVDEQQALSQILEEYKRTIEKHHQKQKSAGRPYPEVDILKVWCEVIRESIDFGWICYDGQVRLRRLTLIFEILSNKVYPMPGMKEIIATLVQKDMPLGIISNAQFYTPIVMSYFLTGEFEEKDTVPFFETDLQVYSYKLLRAKPDPQLFETLVPVLKKKYGLRPDQVLYIGNDMLKDIYPAKNVGFRTALFAGDKRSLRLREDDPLVKDIKPDYILTHLEQLREVIQ